MNLEWEHDDSFDPEDEIEERPKNKFLRVFLILATLVGGLTLGPTLAAQISLGNGTVEFAQGLSLNAACDSNITVSSTAAFANATGSGAHNLDQITLSDIANSCRGQSLKINLYGNTSGTPLNSTPIVLSFALASSTFLTSGATFQSAVYDFSSVGLGGTGKSSVTINSVFSSGTTQIPASSVYKISLESTKTYQVGDAGPSGGVVIMIPTALGGVGVGNFYESWTNDESFGTNFIWSNSTSNTTLIGTSTAIGTGKANTVLMGSGAAGGACSGTSHGGYSDWFLPAKDELQQLWLNRNYLSNWRDQGYYGLNYRSSSESSSSNSWSIRFGDGLWLGDGYSPKAGNGANNVSGPVRCVRQF